MASVSGADGGSCRRSNAFTRCSRRDRADAERVEVVGEQDRRGLRDPVELRVALGVLERHDEHALAGGGTCARRPGRRARRRSTTRHEARRMAPSCGDARGPLAEAAGCPSVTPIRQLASPDGPAGPEADLRRHAVELEQARDGGRVEIAERLDRDESRIVQNSDARTSTVPWPLRSRTLDPRADVGPPDGGARQAQDRTRERSASGIVRIIARRGGHCEATVHSAAYSPGAAADPVVRRRLPAGGSSGRRAAAPGRSCRVGAPRGAASARRTRAASGSTSAMPWWRLATRIRPIPASVIFC